MKPFHLYIDSADLDELSQCLPHPVIHGVTTNPTILKRAGVTRAALPGLFEKLFKLGVKQVQAQVHAAECDAMLEDARTLLAGFDRLPASRQFMAWLLLLLGGAIKYWRVRQRYPKLEPLEVSGEEILPGAEAALGLQGLLLAHGIAPRDAHALLARLRTDPQAHLPELTAALPALQPPTPQRRDFLRATLAGQQLQHFLAAAAREHAGERVAHRLLHQRMPLLASHENLHALRLFASFFVPFYFFHAGTQVARDALTAAMAPLRCSPAVAAGGLAAARLRLRCEDGCLLHDLLQSFARGEDAT